MVPKRAPNTASRELADGELVVLAADGSQAVVLNPLGAAVWQLIDGARTVSAIAAFITERFPDQDPAQVQADVAALLERLVELGTVELGA